MKIPKYVENIVSDLEKTGKEAYIVGGCVRDLFLDKEPKDWDITTNAKPEEILKVFPDGKYENIFGTVLIPIKQENKEQEIRESLDIVTKNIKVDKIKKGKAIKIAEKYLKKIECEAHDIRHSVNVAKNSLGIAKEYKDINIDIMEIVSYFHDVGRANYDDERHIVESQKIVKKELEKLFDKNIFNIIYNLIYHDFDLPAKSLEEQILKEADLIDGIDVERCNIVQKINLEEHFVWIKNNFNKEKYYSYFITDIGKKILMDNIYKFNIGNFSFKIPEFKEAIKDIVEITTYRSEQGYSDRRHPDEIKFETNLDKDLERRDFTINAIAMDSKGEFVDLFGGQKDIKKKIIRAVGEPTDRFKEDALRMMRAIRLACQLKFSIEPKTERAIKKLAGGIKFVSKERIKDELIKILESDMAYEGIMYLYNNKLLQYILPELERGVGVDQKGHHTYTVFKHSVLSLKYCPNKDWRIRLASLLHDVAKPNTKRLIKGDTTFYNHDIVGAKVTKKIMQRLRFSNDDVDKVTTLIRNHMFYYSVGEVTESSVRRLIVKVGSENLKDLIDLRIADRLGSGVPKAKPYKLRHLEYMMEKVRQDPVSVKMVKISGDDLIKILKIKPGPKIGAILDVLLSELIEEPENNNKKYLEKRSKELNELDLKELRDKAKEKIEEKKMEDDRELKKEFWVK